MSSCLRVLVLVLAAASSVTALAQPAPAALKKQAKAYVHSAQAAEAKGDYDAAIALYAKAYDLIPHPILLFNQGQDSRLAGRRADAIAYYERFLATHPSGNEATVAREWLAVFARDVAEEARKAEAQAPRTADTASARKPDTDAARKPDVEAPRRAVAMTQQPSTEVLRKPDPEPAPKPEPAPPPRPSPSPAPVVRRVAPASARSLRPLLAYSLAGAGVVAAGVGLVFGLRARSSWQQAHADDHCDAANLCDPRGLALTGDADRDARRASILVAAGAAALVAGTVVLLTAPGERAAPPSTAVRAQPWLSPSAAGLAVAGAF